MIGEDARARAASQAPRQPKQALVASTFALSLLSDAPAGGCLRRAAPACQSRACTSPSLDISCSLDASGLNCLEAAAGCRESQAPSRFFAC